jgi:hypothetical protein
MRGFQVTLWDWMWWASQREILDSLLAQQWWGQQMESLDSHLDQLLLAWMRSFQVTLWDWMWCAWKKEILCSTQRLTIRAQPKTGN